MISYLNQNMSSLIRVLNGRWHNLALQIFLMIVIAHLAEHIAQVIQLWLLGWMRPQCMGLLGLAYPWLMKSEWLHYGHALFMLVGLAVFRPSFGYWWNVAFIIQFWHHFEHALLLGQALIQDNFYDFVAPVSVAQLVVQYWGDRPFFGQPYLPRIELHLFYNLVVFVPMLVALSLDQKTKDGNRSARRFY